MAVLFKPVAQLGGDLYDWIAFDDGRLAIVIGDVAGKGAPAALYGALSSGVIRTRAGRKYPPAQMLELVNKTLYQRPIEGQYVAVTYAIYDPQIKRTLTPFPLRRARARRPTHLPECRHPLGLSQTPHMKRRPFRSKQAMSLVFYSDTASSKCAMPRATSSADGSRPSASIEKA
jgi:sigma-B regulation protein RsbU (phosphoserine phosphatase)